MVVTFAPSICHTKTVHALTALPSTCTTQAPHWDVSQPTWVPVSRRCSRRYCTRRVRGSTSPVTALPFTVIATAVMAFLLKVGPKASFSRRQPEPAADRIEFGAILPPSAVWNKSTLNPDTTAGQGFWTDSSGRRGKNQSGLARDQPPDVTASLKRTKKSSAVFLAALLIRRWPNWASLPPICASTL